MYIFIFIYLHIFWTPQGRVCPFTRYSLNFALAASVCRPQTRNLRWPLHIYPRHSDLVSVSKKKEKEKKNTVVEISDETICPGLDILFSDV